MSSGLPWASVAKSHLVSSSARMVNSTSGLRLNSRAIWKEYSFNCLPLGGKVPTRQIFMENASKYCDAEIWPELLAVSAGEVEEGLLLHARGEAQRICVGERPAGVGHPAADRHCVRDLKSIL